MHLSSDQNTGKRHKETLCYTWKFDKFSIKFYNFAYIMCEKFIVIFVTFLCFSFSHSKVGRNRQIPAVKWKNPELRIA